MNRGDKMIDVLIVDDEIHSRKGLKLTTPWEELKCKVVGDAKDGEEGLKMMEDLKPQLVITDVKMPKMSGIEMIDAYEKKNADAPIAFIILSGYEDFKYAQQAIHLGVKEYLLKPVEDEVLFNTIKKITRKMIGEWNEEEPQDVMKEKVYQMLNFKAYESSLASKKSRYVHQAVRQIEKEYFNEVNIKIVAEELYITESYLSRLFKKETGYTFVEYLTRYRLVKALELMRNQDLKVYQVAELSGFNDSRYFSLIVKKYLNMTPTELKAIL